jgi:hypothetical protein
MPSAKENEVAQTLIAQRAKKALDECLAIGRTPRCSNGLDPKFSQGVAKARCILAISIMLNESYTQAGFATFPHKRFSLGRYPSLIGMQRGRRDDDASGLDVEKDKQERVTDALHGQDLLTEKVSLPQTDRMAAKKLIPGSTGPLGARIEAIFLEDVANRTLAQGTDSELPEFAHDSRVAPGIFLGQLDDQLSDLLGCTTPTTLRIRVTFSAGPFVFPNPT